jgi:hypothetical protein
MKPFNQNENVFKSFKGTFDHGGDETVPPDHFLDSLNVMFEPSGIKSRHGSTVDFTQTHGNISHFKYFHSTVLGDICLFCTTTGELYHRKSGTDTLLVTVSGMTSFAALETPSLIYISPNNGSYGIGPVFTWDGTDLRETGSIAPTSANQMTYAHVTALVAEQQTIAITGSTGGTFFLNTSQGITNTLPYNCTDGQIQTVLEGANASYSWVVPSGYTTYYIYPGVEVESEGFVGTDMADSVLISTLDASNFQACIAALDNVGSSNVIVTGDGTSGTPYIITFVGALAGRDVYMNMRLILPPGSYYNDVSVTKITTGGTIYGMGNVSVASKIVTFGGDFNGIDIPLMTADITALTGTAPAVTITETTKGSNAGYIEQGVHKFAVCYETATGFITAPGIEFYDPVGGTFDFSPLIIHCPGEKQLTLSTVPLGSNGTGTTPAIIARYILATRADEEEFFFVPNGVISDNSSTSITISFYDSDLIESADYLFDIHNYVPAGLGICMYGTRLAVWGFASPDQILLRISRSGDLETFSQLDGFTLVGQNDKYAIEECFELNNIIYILKSKGAYGAQDDFTNEPASWSAPVLIDGGISAKYGSVSKLPNLSGSTTKNRVLIADSSGLLVFDGVFRRPELSWKINSIWNRINKTYFYKIQIFDDPINKRIYIAVPLDAATEPDYVLYGDYSECGQYPDHKNIKWTLWQFNVPSDPVDPGGPGGD